MAKVTWINQLLVEGRMTDNITDCNIGFEKIE